MTMGTSDPGVFCGGDLADIAETTVEAVADGKIAAWSLHRCGFIQQKGLHGPKLFFQMECSIFLEE